MHNCTLQRLDFVLNNDNIATKYPKSSFYDGIFDDVPLIYCDKAIHPDLDAVSSGELPENYKIVGKIAKSWV